MPTKVRPQQAVALLSQKRAALRQRLRRVVEESIDEALEVALALSSGTRSLKELAKLDHPYALRHGRPLLPPHVINKQSGQFYSAWKVLAVKVTSRGIFGRVLNDDWKAGLLRDGTDKMFPRPIDDAVKAYIRPRFERRVRAALRNL